MTKKSCDEVSKLERKTVEKNRRMKMKNLCFKLSSLIPRKTGLSKEAPTHQQDHLEEATVYIKKVQERIEKLKRKKEMGVVIDENPDGIDESKERSSSETPIVEIRELENSLSEIFVICGRNKRFALYDAISVVEEEGAEIINGSTSIVGANICYSIQSQIKVPRIGLDVSRLEEKLRKLVN